MNATRHYPRGVGNSMDARNTIDRGDLVEQGFGSESQVFRLQYIRTKKQNRIYG